MSFEFSFHADKEKDSFRFLKEADVLSEFLWGLYFKFMMFGYFISHVMMCGLSVFLCITFKGYFDADSVLHPFRLM